MSLACFATAVAVGVNGDQLAVLGATMAATSALALWAMNTQVARPLEQLRRHAQRAADGEADQRPLDRSDDIGMAQRAVNQLGLRSTDPLQGQPLA
jgi:aerotaxis receptor